MSDDWRCLFTVRTEWAELQVVIDEQIREALLTFMATLVDDLDLSDRDRVKAWLTAAPVIRRQWRQVLEEGWRRMQLEQLPADGMVQ